MSASKAGRHSDSCSSNSSRMGNDQAQQRRRTHKFLLEGGRRIVTGRPEKLRSFRWEVFVELELHAAMPKGTQPSRARGPQRRRLLLE